MILRRRFGSELTEKMEIEIGGRRKKYILDQNAKKAKEKKRERETIWIRTNMKVTDKSCLPILRPSAMGVR